MKLNSQQQQIFFVGDTHFGHHAMVEKWRFHPLWGRRFHDKEEMDDWMIYQWNETVPQHGTIFHLGDVSFRNSTETAAILQQLNGEIHLIEGNHDKGLATYIKEQFFASIQPYLELRVGRRAGLGDLKIVLCHYAFRTWNRAHFGAWNLHGHSHDNLPRRGGQLDVGVDSNAITESLRPVSLQEVAHYMADRPYEPVDHHISPSERKAGLGNERGEEG